VAFRIFPPLAQEFLRRKSAFLPENTRVTCHPFVLRFPSSPFSPPPLSSFCNETFSSVLSPWRYCVGFPGTAMRCSQYLSLPPSFLSFSPLPPFHGEESCNVPRRRAFFATYGLRTENTPHSPSLRCFFCRCFRSSLAAPQIAQAHLFVPP